MADNDEIVPQCAYCLHWSEGACKAYPGGVPYLILSNKVDHRQPFPLDRHLRFRPYSLEADAKQRALFERREAEPQPRRQFPFFWRKG